MDMKYTLVLVRHGESTWNKENLFTGWVDVPLSEGGVGEAGAGAKLLKEEGFTFDLAYTSTLKRAIKTLWIILEGLDLMYIPIVNTWRLNERHCKYRIVRLMGRHIVHKYYFEHLLAHRVFLVSLFYFIDGSLQGLNKQETVDKHGKEQVLVWRRSYDIPPPVVDRSSVHHPSNDPRYKGVEFDDEFTESLKTTGERFMPDWENKIGPDIKAGKKVIIAAHGNTLRALVQMLDNISDEEICGLNIPTGVPLIYELDDDLKPIPHPDAIAPLQGRYLGNQEEVRARIEGVANQTK